MRVQRFYTEQTVPTVEQDSDTIMLLLKLVIVDRQKLFENTKF